MAVRDHVSRVPKLRAKIVTVDPSQRLIEAITAEGGTPRRLTLNDIPQGFMWPVEGEEWSIYEENGNWRLGHKFLNTDESAAFETMEPGTAWAPNRAKTLDGSVSLNVYGQPFDKAVPMSDGTKATWSAIPPIPIVTSLPSPSDFNEIYYSANPTNGIFWHLKYHAESASPYKWVYVGGGSLTAEGVGGQNWLGSNPSTTSLNYTTIDGLGPSITVPLAGDYTIEGQSVTKASIAQNLCGFLFWIASDGIVSWQLGDAVTVPSAAANGGTIYGRRNRTLAANTTIEMRYATSNSSSAATFYNRGLYVRPVRVG